MVTFSEVMVRKAGYHRCVIEAERHSWDQDRNTAPVLKVFDHFP